MSQKVHSDSISDVPGNEFVELFFGQAGSFFELWLALWLFLICIRVAELLLYKDGRPEYRVHFFAEEFAESTCAPSRT